MQTYRLSQLSESYTLEDGTQRNFWCTDITNGKTLLFLLERDPEIQDFYKDIGTPSKWHDVFFYRCSQDCWPLISKRSERLDNLKSPALLERLMDHESFPGVNSSVPYSVNVRGKIDSNPTSFYRYFKDRYALTALAWIDNNGIWDTKKPEMANLMREALLDHPDDALGAYLVWSCGLSHKLNNRFKKPFEHSNTYFDNDERKKELLTIASRVGLDTTEYEQHALGCIALHKGLNLELNTCLAIEYSRAVYPPAMPDLGNNFGMLMN